MPVYPGDPAVVVESVGVIAKDGFCDQRVTLGTHAGTHIDSPAHMIEGGKQLKDYPVETFIRRGTCIDVGNGFSAQAIEGANIQAGDAVLFCTGASKYFTEEKYWHEYKALDESCLKLLVEKRVAIVGFDTCSADIEESFPVHKTLLGADILIVENLTNLGRLVGKTFEFQALPLKLEKDGAPVRAIAKL